jgi:hypothetical protein
MDEAAVLVDRVAGEHGAIFGADVLVDERDRLGFRVSFADGRGFDALGETGGAVMRLVQSSIAARISSGWWMTISGPVATSVS